MPSPPYYDRGRFSLRLASNREAICNHFGCREDLAIPRGTGDRPEPEKAGTASEQQSLARAFVFFWLAVDRGLHFRSVMNRYLLPLAAILCCAAELIAQPRDAVVKRDEVSIHTVERGSMPIFASANGTLTSLQPHRALLSFDDDQGKCEAGRGARLVVGENPRPLTGKVVGPTDDGNCEIEFADALPQGAMTGDKVGGLILTDELKDVVFFGRPADSRPNSTATIFVLEGTSAARRVTVQYGAMTGPLIQVLHGLSPGDKVIVTDMSKWADVPRVQVK